MSMSVWLRFILVLIVGQSSLSNAMQDDETSTEQWVGTYDVSTIEDYRALRNKLCTFSMLENENFDVNALDDYIADSIAGNLYVDELSLPERMEEINTHMAMLSCFRRPFTFYSIDSGQYPLILEDLILERFSNPKVKFDINKVFLIKVNRNSAREPMTLLDYYDQTLLNPTHDLYDEASLDTVRRIRKRLVSELNASNFRHLSFVSEVIDLDLLSTHPNWDAMKSIALTQLMLTHLTPRHVFHGIKLLKEEVALNMNDKEIYRRYGILRPQDLQAIASMVNVFPDHFDDDFSCAQYFTHIEINSFDNKNFGALNGWTEDLIEKVYSLKCISSKDKRTED